MKLTENSPQINFLVTRKQIMVSSQEVKARSAKEAREIAIKRAETEDAWEDAGVSSESIKAEPWELRPNQIEKEESK